MQGCKYLSLLLLPVTLYCTTVEASEIQYEITDLGTLGGPRSYAYAINELGQIVGHSNTGLSTFGYIWDNGTMTSLEGMGGNTFARDINNSGLIVGWTMDSLARRGYVWQSGTGQALPKYRTYEYQSWANSVNEYSQIVGATDLRSSNFTATLGILWESGVMSGLLSNSRDAEATTINDNGVAAGWTDTTSGDIARLQDASGVTNIGKLSVGKDAHALDINNTGIAVGYGDVAQLQPHAFVWDSNLGIRDLGTLGGASSTAHSINEHGMIVGSAENELNELKATIWMNGEAFDLSQSISVNSGWDTLIEAFDINDRGQIVGYGRLEGSQFDRAFLLTPVPEPMSLSILAIGLAATLCRRRR